MERVLTRVCDELHNWFTHEYIRSEFTIQDGSIALPDALDGQYIRIVGSALNDGVYKYPCYGLADETFTGAIGLMRIPLVVLDVVAELEAVEGAAGSSGGSSPYSSESFNGYSYSRAANSDGTPMSAEDAAWAAGLRRLRPWRKMP